MVSHYTMRTDESNISIVVTEGLLPADVAEPAEHWREQQQQRYRAWWTGSSQLDLKPAAG